MRTEKPEGLRDGGVGGDQRIPETTGRRDLRPSKFLATSHPTGRVIAEMQLPPFPRAFRAVISFILCITHERPPTPRVETNFNPFRLYVEALLPSGFLFHPSRRGHHSVLLDASTDKFRLRHVR